MTGVSCTDWETAGSVESAEACSSSQPLALLGVDLLGRFEAPVAQREPDQALSVHDKVALAVAAQGTVVDVDAEARAGGDLDRAAVRLRDAAGSAPQTGDHCLKTAEGLSAGLNDPATRDRAGLLAAAERYLAAQPQRWEDVEHTTRIAADAIKRSLEAARLLSDAAETLGFWIPGGVASVGRAQAAEFDLDRAEKATASVAAPVGGGPLSTGGVPGT